MAIPSPRDLAAIRRLIVQAEPDIRFAFLRALSAVRDGTRVATVADLLERGQFDAALRLVPWDMLGEPYILDQLIPRLRAVAEGTARIVSVAMGGTFSVIDPTTMQALAGYGADLVTLVSSETREALRQVLMDSQAEGLSALRAARRLKAEVGLNAPQQRAVAAFRKRLIDDGVSGRELDRRTWQYAIQKHNERGLLIARTEAGQASRIGQFVARQQQIAAGLLDPNKAEKEWLTAGDEAVRDKHRELNGQVVPIGEPFRIPSTGELIPGAPHSYSCRCNELLYPEGKAAEQ